MEGDLSRIWRKAKKKRGWEDGEGILADLREAFVHHCPVPEELAEELADYFMDGELDQGDVFKSEEVLDLLSGRWTAQGSLLEDADWDFLKDVVNAWALELDMDIVTDVMRAVVDRGGFRNFP